MAGTMPSLTELAADEPVMTTDFRQVYAATLVDWLGLPADAALSGASKPLSLFKSRCKQVD
jgi:uncharacterized protein (DUF1501 family)